MVKDTIKRTHTRYNNRARIIVKNGIVEKRSRTYK
jgi:hypothetical protein